MKLDVARTIEKLGLEPIILHEQSNKGRDILTKFKDHSDVVFAVVILSPDDVGGLKPSSRDLPDPTDYLRPRARQNVVFELGYFIAKLPTHCVVAIKPPGEFEMPSDYPVIYIDYDKAGHWRYDLVKELKAADYQVSADSL